MAAYKPVTHVIFDLDGLLLDTETLYTAATERVLQPFNRSYDWELKVSQMGQKAESCANIIISSLKIPLSVEDYLQQVKDIHKEIMPTAQVMPDTETLYRQVAEHIASEYGKIHTFELHTKCMGTTAVVDAQYNIEAHDLPLTVDQYLEKVKLGYKQVFPKAAILPDTEKLYSASTQAVVGPYGKEYTWEIKCPLMGRVGIELAKAILKALEVPLSPEEYLCRVEKEYEHFFPQAKLMSGAEKLVRHLHEHQIPIAIASGGAQESYDLKTTNHKEFMSMFKHIVLASTDAEVKHGKPAPDVFLVCAKRFPDSPNPEKCLVFEDAPNGVAASVAAGMQVVMVPDQRMADEMKKDATIVLKSLEDFQPELFGLPPYSK